MKKYILNYRVLRMNVVRFILLAFGVSAGSHFFFPSKGQTQGSKEAIPGYTLPAEVPVLGVFVSQYGFDDNDFVELVIDGQLPNACWVVGESRASVQSSNKNSSIKGEIVVSQLAQKKLIEGCEEGGSLNSVSNKPVSFISSIKLDQRLQRGEYAVKFTTKESINERSLVIDAAPTDSGVDSLSYAQVTSLYVPPVVKSKDSSFKVEMMGKYTSQCSEIDKEVRNVQFGNVITLFPQESKINKPCSPTDSTFKMEVELAPPSPGRYLLQVRRSNGESINTLFTVK